MTAASAGPASAAPRPDWRLVVGFAALTILIHFLTNGAYGYFRDELYFMGKCCNFENGDGGGPERNWAARSQAARSNSWSMN